MIKIKSYALGLSLLQLFPNLNLNTTNQQTMKRLILILLWAFPILVFAQTNKPAYCNDLPAEYDARGSSKRGSLPKFGTVALVEYKVQVAILKNSHPADYPFHKSLVARYRPCEEVWVVESRQSFESKSAAESLKKDLIRLGYKGAYITELVGFQ